MTAYLYSISQQFTGVDKNPYNGEKLMWSMLGSLDQEIINMIIPLRGV